MTAPALPLRARVPGAATAEVSLLDGRTVVLVRTDPTVRRGAMTESDGETVAAAVRAAVAARVPLVGVLSTSGADVGDGVAALHGWGRAAAAMSRASGVVPIILIVTGPAVSGPALLLGLADVVIMTDEAFAYVSGPNMVVQFTGVELSEVALGGAAVHARATGVAALIAPDEVAALDLASTVLAYLPDHADAFPPLWPTADRSDRATPELADLLPATSTGSYDVREVATALADDGETLELGRHWAPNLVTMLTTIDGAPVGVVANQPQALAGTLDIAASQKGASFVNLCDAFGLPLVTLVDTPGYFPGKDLEWRGIIRKGAQLAFAYAMASVPRVCVILRKAYGGAYIVMDSKGMGNDLCLAWPSAEVAVMGAQQAVQIIYRSLSPAEQAERQAEYEQTLLNPYVAAERGFVDMVIDPVQTRAVVADCLRSLADKREQLPGRKHANPPL
jgi:acetyl-CoA carboxylase carboxyltransferase component